MQKLKSEFAHSYKTYTFGYAEYAVRENGDELSDIYEKGYLPYSGSPDIKDTLYMARSARVNLEQFEPSSENRRMLKRFDDVFTRSVTRFQPSDFQDEKFLAFCLNYFEKRHGPEVMPRERLLTILNAGFISDIITYKENDRIVGYALEVSDHRMGHYWYSFYDLEFAFKGLGMWVMIDCAREAKKVGKKHYYIGTVYGEKALYKTNFDGIEFWNGNEWVKDKKHLRELARTDAEHVFDHADRWKEGRIIF